MKMSLVNKVKANIGKAALLAVIPVMVSGCAIEFFEARSYCPNRHSHGNEVHCGHSHKEQPKKHKNHKKKNCHYHGRSQVYHCGHKHW
jgi:hypothetical protein